MKPHPILLIHGLGGRPEDWKEAGFVDFLIQEGNYDPDLIRLFDYGYKRVYGVPKYNYQGDITEIAHRLADDPTITEALPYQVDQLSQESVAKGGPELVDIITFSLGGLIARYYMSCSFPNHWGTVYKGKVGKLIEIGVPNLGIHWLTLYQRVLKGSWLWRLIVLLSRLPLLPINLRQDVQTILSTLAGLQERTLKRLETKYDQPIDPDSLAGRQMTPGSRFLKWLNRAAKTPPGVKFYCLYGDFLLDLEIHLLGLHFRRCFSFGDFVVLPQSATTVPGAHPVMKAYENRFELALGLPEQRTAVQAEALPELPPYTHITLNDQPEVQGEVLKILEAD